MVSVIITTYKREPAMILRALNSVLVQTYKDYEIIIVDDSPSDFVARGDVHAAIEQQQRLHPEIGIYYIPHEKNMGACAARNTGLGAAKGEYIAYLDDDDEWLPEKLEKQVRLMSDTSIALIYCGRLLKNDETDENIIEKTEYLRGNVFKTLIDHNFIGSTSFPLIRTAILKEVGGFDVLMKSSQDYDVWLRIAERYRIDYIAEPLVMYHTHAGEQITSNPQKKIDGLERLNEKYQPYLDKDKKLWWRRNIVIVPYYAKNGNRKKALKLWTTCVLKRPGVLFDNLRYFIRIFS